MKDSLKTQKLKKKSRKLSVIEGSFATIRQSLGDTYVAPFAIALNAGNATVAMLSSITG